MDKQVTVSLYYFWLVALFLKKELRESVDFKRSKDFLKYFLAGTRDTNRLSFQTKHSLTLEHTGINNSGVLYSTIYKIDFFVSNHVIKFYWLA